MLNLHDPMSYSPIIEPGIGLHEVAPEFTIPDHDNRLYHRDNLMSENGLLMGFIGDIWNPANIQRILWLQRHTSSIMRQGFGVALIVRDRPHLLYGFYVSTAKPLQFPLLSDLRGDIHDMFNMGRTPGMVMLDDQFVIRHKWLMPEDRIWPRIHDLVEVLEAA